ncbi:tetratricopeptide repeat protein [Dankookia rubra]|uniref:tetratricopeptide repeat protein n=1 Tax=Dankookia rubra TaxID=1442381 RepID=UPI001409947B|nr:tetratricopeptide repeat protein [Dankookia rubra]
MLAFASLAIGAAMPIEPRPPALEVPREGHVGAVTCGGCHAAAYADWQGSHHRHAMAAAADASVAAPFAGESVRQAGRESRFSRRDGRFFARIEGPDGQDAEFEVTHTLGVAPLQQYLAPLPGGRLQPLPWAWDARPAVKGGQRWFHLYPGEEIRAGDPLHWTGRIQNWNMQCAACHTTDLRRNALAGGQGYATEAAATGVTCEACHGAGARHVAWAQGRRRPEDAATQGLAVRFPAGGGQGGWVMNATRGVVRWEGPPRSTPTLDVCGPCHARRREIAADPVPGRPFLDAYVPALLEEGLYHPDGANLDEVFEWGSFVQSRMHRAGVTCTDCHSPHSGKLRAEGNALCLQCHAAERFDVAAHHRHAEGSAGAQCVNCHMPSRTYMVVHARRDHALRVPRPDLSARLGTPDVCTDCHRDRGAAWAAERVAAWHGGGRAQIPHWSEAIAAGRAGEHGAGDRLLGLAADPEAPAIARATALSLLPANSARGILSALTGAVRDADPLLRMTGAAALSSLPPRERIALAAPLLDDAIRAVRLEAARALAPVPEAALTPAQVAARARAMDEIVAAARLNADQPDALTGLGTVFADQGRAAEAEAEFRAALRLDAAHVPAVLGLAEVFRRTAHERAAEAVLREGLAAAPTSAPLHHALGLSQVRLRQIDKAVETLGHAAALEPSNARFAYVYGMALRSTGRPDMATAVLHQALARHPTQRDILLLLAVMARDAGEWMQTREYAERLLAIDPQDRQALQLLSEVPRR